MDNCWKRKRWLRIDVGRNCHVPHWYGVAYVDYVSDHAVCYPIPFNWLVHWGQAIYNKICFPNMASSEYARGFQDGVRTAKERAYQEGYRQGFEDGSIQKEGPTSIH